MIFKVEHNDYIIGSLRRKWRKTRQFTLRVTHSGTVSIIRMPLHRDVRTEAQLKCRARFNEAQRLMLEALTDAKLLRFFKKRQRSKGYKTLRGCIRAYYIDKLIFEEFQAAQRALAAKMSVVLSDVEVASRVTLPSQSDKCVETPGDMSVTQHDTPPHHYITDSLSSSVLRADVDDG